MNIRQTRETAEGLSADRSMKTALVILTKNAERSGLWTDVLDAVDSQTFRPDLKLIADSGSSDGTRAAAEERRWQIRTVRPQWFDHGLTRTRILRKLAREGFDTTVFLSQDVVPAAPDALEKLVGYLRKNRLAGCYGRQIGRPGHATQDAWQRARFYPAVSDIRDRTNGGMPGPVPDCFFSNAFAAWDIREALKAGGFPRTGFGEDTILAEKILASGGRTGYCAEATAFHEHAETAASLFARGVRIGILHRLHPEIAERVRASSKLFRKERPPARAILPCCIKLSGYVSGCFPQYAIPALIFLLMWIFLIPGILLYDFPMRDVIGRYAPMAEAFAHGDWRYAFHPRIPPLLPVCAGALLAILPCGAYTACRLASGLLLTLSVFPLFAGCRRIYGLANAAISTLLFATTCYLIRLGYYGVREAGSVLGVTLLFLAAARLREDRRSKAGFFWFAAGETVLLCNRGDTALAAACAFAVLFLWDWIRNRHPLRSLLTGLTILFCISPVLYRNYRMIGSPVLDFRQANILRKLEKRLPLLRRLRNESPEMPMEQAGKKEADHE